MFLGLNSQEIQLLNRFNLLAPENKREVNDYLCYLIMKQYRAELNSQVLGNPLIYNGLLQAIRMCERDDLGIDEILQKIRQIKFLYYQLLEKIYCKYADILEGFYTDELLKDWGRLGFESVFEAAQKQSKESICTELEEMVQGYNRLAKKEGKRKFVAV